MRITDAIPNPAMNRISGTIPSIESSTPFPWISCARAGWTIHPRTWRIRTFRRCCGIMLSCSRSNRRPGLLRAESRSSKRRVTRLAGPSTGSPPIVSNALPNPSRSSTARICCLAPPKPVGRGGRLIQLGQSGPDQILHQFFIDFPIDRDLKAVLEDDKLPQPHLKVFDDSRTPG